MTLLQVNPLAGERLCSARDQPSHRRPHRPHPRVRPPLADERMLAEVRDREEELNRLLGLLDSRPDPDAKIGTIRRMAAQEAPDCGARHPGSG